MLIDLLTGSYFKSNRIMITKLAGKINKIESKDAKKTGFTPSNSLKLPPSKQITETEKYGMNQK